MLKYAQATNQNDNIDTGQLQISIVRRDSRIPIENSTVRISYTGFIMNQSSVQN